MSAYELLCRGREAPWTLSPDDLHRYKTLEQAEDHEWDAVCRTAPLLSVYPPDVYCDECPELDDTYEPDEEDRLWLMSVWG